jgi:hypothetical protein
MPLDVGQPLANAVRVAHEIVAAAWEPPPPIDYTAWAEKNVVFGNESPKPGPYDRRYHPWDVLIHKALAPEHWARVVVLTGSAQTIGKTTTAQIFVGGSQDMDPGPLIYYHPTENNALKWVKTKWKAFVRGCETSLKKIFPSAEPRFLEQPAVPGARRRPRLDHELGRQLGERAQPGVLAAPGPGRSREVGAQHRRRPRAAGRQPQRGLPLGEDPQDRHAADLARLPDDESLQALRPGRGRGPVPALRSLPAAALGELQGLGRRDQGRAQGRHARDRAALHLHGLRRAIEQRHRAEIVTPEKIREHFTNWDEGRRLAVYGLRVWSAYSPQKPWADIAEGWLAAEGDPKREQTFFNDVLGLDYLVAGAAPPWEKIRERAEALKAPLGIIPVGGIIVTIGVDCQARPLRGARQGLRPRRPPLHRRVHRDRRPHQRGQGQDALDALLKRTWRDSFGNRRRLDMLAIDAGAWKTDVHDWAKRHPQDRVIMVRGVRGDAAPAMSPVKEERKASTAR